MNVSCYQYQIAIAIVFCFAVWRFVMAVHISDFKRLSSDKAFPILTAVECDFIVIEFGPLSFECIFHQPSHSRVYQAALDFEYTQSVQLAFALQTGVVCFFHTFL